MVASTVTLETQQLGTYQVLCECSAVTMPIILSSYMITSV